MLNIGVDRTLTESRIDRGFGRKPDAGLSPAPLSMRLFAFMSLMQRQAAIAKRVKSPVAKKDALALTRFSVQNLIEVSGNLFRLRVIVSRARRRINPLCALSPCITSYPCRDGAGNLCSPLR